MSLVFREGRPDDVSAVAGLALHSFPTSARARDDWETWLREPDGDHSLWVGEEAGRIVAGCRLYRFQQWIGGAEIRTMGLGLVAVSPMHRRRRIAEELVATGFQAALARGDVASALYPFRSSFYRKLGYGMAGEALQYRVPPRNLPDHPGRAHVRLVESDDDRALVQAVYDEWAPRQTGQLARDARAWRNVWERGPSHGAIYQGKADSATGYAIFRYVTDAPPGQRSVDVEEIAWLDREARLGLYGWLASLADQWDFVLYRAHPQEAFAEHLRELRPPAEGIPPWSLWFPAAVSMAGPMFRILDVERAWAARAVGTGEEMTVALEVQDPQVPDNAGSWELRLEGGAATARQGTSAAPDLRLTTSIEILSRIYIGALTVADALLAGVAEGDAGDVVPRLDALLRLPKPWTFDRF